MLREQDNSHLQVKDGGLKQILLSEISEGTNLTNTLTFSLEIYEKLCCLSYAVCGILLEQPEEMNTV